MTKDEFLSGAKFRNERLKANVYQFEPGKKELDGTVKNGYVWQLIPGLTRILVGVCSEIVDASAVVSFVVLGKYTVIPIVYSEFELCQPVTEP
jgi:hypothetical protein